MKKTGYSEIDAMFVTTDLSSELEEFKVYYEELSKIKNNELKKLFNNLKIEEKKFEEKLEIEFKENVISSIETLLNFHKVALLKLNLYGEDDPRWSVTKKTQRERQYFKEYIDSFSISDIRSYINWKHIALYSYVDYSPPNPNLTFEEWMKDCRISNPESWHEIHNKLKELNSGFFNEIFNRNSCLRIHEYYKKRIKNIETVSMVLKPIYSDAAKAVNICRNYIDEYKIFTSKFDSTYRKKSKVATAVLEGVSLKHFLLECESEYNERLY
jgi:hypothetical protein